ncbi:metallophosphoesterase [Microbacteriaceae bacterium 4G12]
MLIFFLILLAYIGINIYIGWHGYFVLSYFSIPFSPTVYWVLFSVIALSYLLGRFHLLPGPVGRFFQVIGSYYFAILEFVVILLPLADLAAWMLRFAGVDDTVYIPIISVTVLLLLSLLLFWGSRNAWSPVIRTYEFCINKQVGDLKKLRIAVASDLHLGNIVGNRHLSRLVTHINALKPDLILLPGDVIDDSVEPFIRENMSAVMKQLESRYGIYAVLGNHEYYGGHIEEYVKQMDAIGIKVLRDESVLMNDAFYVVGRKDKAAEKMDPNGRLSLPTLLENLDVTRPVIVMDHQPYQFDVAANAGVDLLLCGHTHRGQFAPNHWITGRLFELDWGYLLKNKMHVIVSSGFGTWGPPIRLASRSEIIEIVIRFE